MRSKTAELEDYILSFNIHEILEFLNFIFSPQAVHHKSVYAVQRWEIKKYKSKFKTSALILKVLLLITYFWAFC